MTAYSPAASRGRVVRGLLMVAAAVTVLLGARAQIADAASPTLTASENPVVIPAPASTKAITLTYNLGGSLSKATLTVEVVGGPSILSQPITSQTGSVPFTATLGKTYKAQILDPYKFSAVATLQITTQQGQPSPGGDPNGACGAALCVRDWDVFMHGTYAEVPVTTDKPAHFALTASTGKPNPDGTFAKIDSSAISFGNFTSWTGMLPNLEPNTTYYVVLTASDAANTVTVMKQSSFRTLARRVEVTFAKVTVTDDSDDLGACECTFFFKAGDAPTKSFGEVSVSDPNSVLPNAMVKIDYAPATVTLRVSGFDDDELCGGLLGLCTCGIPTDVVADSGSNKCFDFSSASKALDVAVSGLGESHDGTFSIVADGSPLTFTVFGSFKVSYFLQ
jgi:hypothetical protein